MNIKEWGMFGLLGLIWGSSFLWIRVAMGNQGQPFLGIALPAGTVVFGPFLLVTMRLFFGMLGLAILLRIYRIAIPREPRIIAGFAFMGIAYAALPFALVAWGETRIDSGMAAILNGTVPLFTILIAHYWLPDDKITMTRFCGLLIGFAGVAVLVVRDTFTLTWEGNLIGQLAVLAAAIFYAISSTFSRKFLRGQSPIAQSFVTMFVAEIVMLLATVGAEQPVQLPSHPLLWFAALWLGLLGSCLAYVLYFSLVNAWGPSRASVVTYIFPVVGLLLGITILGEPADWRLAIGTLLVVSGIIVMNMQSLSQAILQARMAR
jgi:drug/metabolite transporter (DMT)-like permease